MSTSTIAAIATASGQGGVAIIRLSGDQAWSIVEKLVHFKKKNIQYPVQTGRVYHGGLSLPKGPDEGDTSVSDSAMIDEVLVLFFRGPRSYTGEDIAEIHCHGGAFLSRVILKACLELGAAPAMPGEFTKRAFLAGKLDLTQAESVLDLIEAANIPMLRMASQNLVNRSLNDRIEQLAREIFDLQSPIVASVDFPDEVDEPAREPLRKKLEALQKSIDSILEAASRQDILRRPFQVSLMGRPNAGKSSLFNALLASDRSIVTPIAGTTRDTVSESFTSKNGTSITLVDTAGLRALETTEAVSVEALGIDRSWQAAEASQSILYMLDATNTLKPEDLNTLTKLSSLGVPLLVVWNKCDLLSSKVLPSNPLALEAMTLSAATGEGLPTLFEWIDKQVQTQYQTLPEHYLALNQRQKECFHQCREALNEVLPILTTHSLPLDLATVPLSEALRAMNTLLGRDMTEVMLSDVFQRFCVGK
ncbi:MAG: tRNA uridine-5-carboxymethylaminomethyl(34) synthesis GTPase MnmE [Cyanobacteria bacterium]|nr:tRNA uridine-5-carboxymethylaminomethyl(34) synthesis GTPase MnmE [Cyanobacteriota bacterium]